MRLEKERRLALERISDVVMEVQVDEFTPEAARACRITKTSPSFADIFGKPHNGDAGFLLSLCSSPGALTDLLLNAPTAPPARGELCFNHPVEEKTLRVTAAVLGANVLLVVCSDLTDFKQRLELQQQREFVATMQHEHKNALLGQQLAAKAAFEQLHALTSDPALHRLIEREDSLCNGQTI